MKLAAITTTLMTSLLVACGDGVTIGDQNPAVANDAPTGQSPFATSTPADNTTGTPTAPAGDELVQTPAPDATPAPTGLPMVGFVGVNQSADSTITTAFGTFVEVPDASPADLTAIFSDPNEDVCEVFTNSTTDNDATLENRSRSISAGEVLTLTSPAGTFSELVREISGDSVFYSVPQGFISGGLPSSITLDIPGDEFPAFANIAIPVVQALNINSPVAGQTVNTGTAFSWLAGNNPNAYIEITATGATNGVNTTVSCTVQDDGSFTFSAATANELGANFSAQFFSMTREAQASSVNGNALLVVSSSSQ